MLCIVEIPFDTDHFQVGSIFRDHLQLLDIRCTSVRVKTGHFDIALVLERFKCGRPGIAAGSRHNEVILASFLCRSAQDISEGLQCHIFEGTCLAVVEFGDEAVLFYLYDRYRVSGIVEPVISVHGTFKYLSGDIYAESVKKIECQCFIMAGKMLFKKVFIQIWKCLRNIKSSKTGTWAEYRF